MFWRVLAAALLGGLSAGCLEVCYLGQAAAGQEDFGFRARPIAAVLADPTASDHEKAMLGLVEDVKRFGERHGLTPTASYREYVRLDRPAAVWVVHASHPLAFEPVTWWFPIVGRVPYLGWFERRDAERLATALAADGWDVYLRGAAAFSTLGWFADPVLSTMLDDGPTGPVELAEVVLHESVHATRFVPSQPFFNESLANFVARRLALRYLHERLRPDRWQLLAHAEDELRSETRARRFRETVEELEAVYRSRLPSADKLAIKRARLAALQRELGLARAINNAVLANSLTYHSGEAGFAALFGACGGSWPRFLAAIGALEPAAFAAPMQADVDAVVRALALRGCPQAAGR